MRNRPASLWAAVEGHRHWERPARYFA